MPDFDYYRVYLQAGLAEAERYLLSKDLFWPINTSAQSVEPGYPNLTLGSMLLFRTYAGLLAKTGSQKSVYDSIERDIDIYRSRWQVAWQRKAAWEYKSRLRQWGNVLKEIRVDPEDNNPYYRYEIRLRVLLSLLQSEIKKLDPGEQEHLVSLDLLLRALFSPGNFIWKPEFAAGFPKEEYWYLWGNLKEP